MTPEDMDEERARQNAMCDLLAVEIRRFAKRHRMPDSERWFVTISLAAHELAHGCGSTEDKGFEEWLALFVERARLEWNEHKRDCLGRKGTTH